MGSLKNGVGRGQLEDKEEEGGEEEPILMEKSQRFCMFPIRYPQLWEMYKKSQASFWTGAYLSVNNGKEVMRLGEWGCFEVINDGGSSGGGKYGNGIAIPLVLLVLVIGNGDAEEVDLSQDVQQWDSLSNSEKHFVSHVLAFFATSDGIVLENLAARFLNDVQIPEARAFYGFQIAMENVHSGRALYLRCTACFWKHTSGTRGRNIDCSMQLRIFLVSLKSQMGFRLDSKQIFIVLIFICSSNSFAERLVAFACIEGIFFSGSFCAIFWLKKRGLMPGLTFSNELISRDEGLHCDFACLLYRWLCCCSYCDLRILLQKQLQWQKVHHIVHKAVEIETQFVCEALPCALIGMNSTLMSQYIKFVADRLLVALQCHTKYNVENPFDWMEFISLQ
ncbi:hypothetical protein HYC85_019314 [Camellia sinensis]|uniref:Uncharacterized protein n=1 Tax=Camellia sinensis TaxID=4442 RepID=A0A7J7GLG4_CAMSI|nr:hypothetical protein HYC85_019314 [Camellia sinensis]